MCGDGANNDVIDENTHLFSRHVHVFVGLCQHLDGPCDKTEGQVGFVKYVLGFTKDPDHLPVLFKATEIESQEPIHPAIHPPPAAAAAAMAMRGDTVNVRYSLRGTLAGDDQVALMRVIRRGGHRAEEAKVSWDRCILWTVV